MKKRLSKEKAAEIVNLLAEGRDVKELADTYKVSIATIYNFIINGVAVTVSGKAKNVLIAPDSVVVNF
jgi:hypothetical protein